MKAKAKEAENIETKISETTKLLYKLRYAVVSSYYNNFIVQSDQLAIHPSLKKLIGKKPISYKEVPRSRTSRNAAQNSIKLGENSNKTDSEKCGIINRPRAVSTTSDNKIICLNSTRGRNQLKHTLVVGNTSQHLYKQDSASNITHKWMCYLLTKSKVPIEKLVQKVCFCLDPSYKPNDMIEVTSPPFQITKRGYGEFQIKLVIFFRDQVHLKPVQMFHHLKLDKKFEGLQTLGNETISELWTRDFLTLDENDQLDSNNEKIEPNNAENFQKLNHLVDHDYFRFDDISTQALQKIRKITRYSDTKTVKKKVTKKVFREDVVEWLKDFNGKSQDALEVMLKESLSKEKDTNVSILTEHLTDNEDEFIAVLENHDL